MAETADDPAAAALRVQSMQLFTADDADAAAERPPAPKRARKRGSAKQSGGAAPQPKKKKKGATADGQRAAALKRQVKRRQKKRVVVDPTEEEEEDEEARTLAFPRTRDAVAAAERRNDDVAASIPARAAEALMGGATADMAAAANAHANVLAACSEIVRARADLHEAAIQGTEPPPASVLRGALPEGAAEAIKPAQADLRKRSRAQAMRRNLAELRRMLKTAVPPIVHSGRLSVEEQGALARMVSLAGDVARLAREESAEHLAYVGQTRKALDAIDRRQVAMRNHILTVLRSVRMRSTPPYTVFSMLNGTPLVAGAMASETAAARAPAVMHMPGGGALSRVDDVALRADLRRHMAAASLAREPPGAAAAAAAFSPAD